MRKGKSREAGLYPDTQLQATRSPRASALQAVLVAVHSQVSAGTYLVRRKERGPPQQSATPASATKRHRSRFSRPDVPHEVWRGWTFLELLGRPRSRCPPTPVCRWFAAVFGAPGPLGLVSAFTSHGVPRVSVSRRPPLVRTPGPT